LKPRYDYEGSPLWSVTQILSVLPKKELIKWLDTQIQPNKAKTESATKGTIVHWRIHQYIAKEHDLPPQKLELQNKIIPPHMGAAVRDCFSQFLEWYNAHEIRPVWLEKPHYSTELGYAGTPDALMYVDGVLMLLDWKTSNSIWSNYHAQLAAYEHLIEETPKVLKIFKFNENRGSEEAVVNGPEAWKVFKDAREQFFKKYGI